MAVEKLFKMLKLVQKPNVKLFDTSLIGKLEFEKTIYKGNSELFVFRLTIIDEFCNLHGSLHGGCISTLVDVLTTVHAWTVDPFERVAISTDLSSNFFSPVFPKQILEITTEITGNNEQFVYATALLNVGGNIVGIGKHTMFYLNKPLVSILSPHSKP